MMIFKLIIFAYTNYLLTKYFKEKETAYLFLGSMAAALVYLLLPEFLILLPFYILIFFFALDKKEKIKRPAQLLTFLMPLLAAVFSLSFISWIYGYGMRIIYLSGSLFDRSIRAVFYININSILLNIFNNLPLISVVYVFIFFWILLKKSPFRVYIYLYLSPLLLYIGYAYIYGKNPGIIFYAPILLSAFLFFTIFAEEFSPGLQRFFYFFLIVNFFTLSLYLLAVVTVIPVFEVEILENLSTGLKDILIYFKEYAAKNWPGPKFDLIRTFYYR